MWMSFKMDTNGDGIARGVDELRLPAGVHGAPPANPFVVGLPSGSTDLSFRRSTPYRNGACTRRRRAWFWSTTIGALEAL
jgi:hypothetical protein